MAAARSASHEHPARVLGVILGDGRGHGRGQRPGRHRRRVDRRDRADPAPGRGRQAPRVGGAAAAPARLPRRDLVADRRARRPGRRPARRPGPAPDHRRRCRRTAPQHGHPHPVLGVREGQHRPGLDPPHAVAGAARRRPRPAPGQGHAGARRRRADQPERRADGGLAAGPAQGQGRALDQQGARASPRSCSTPRRGRSGSPGPTVGWRSLSSPGQPDRPVALKRRDLPDLLAEELRRLDEDDVYAATARRLHRSRGGAS